MRIPFDRWAGMARFSKKLMNFSRWPALIL
jgi:hypothetical protein